MVNSSRVAHLSGLCWCVTRDRDVGLCAVVRSPEEAFAGPSGFQGSAQGGIEGIDESSQNERLGGPQASRATAPIRVRPS